MGSKIVNLEVSCASQSQGLYKCWWWARKIFNISIFSVFINLYINVPVFCPLHALFISSSSPLSVHPPVLSFPQKVLSKYVIDFLEWEVCMCVWVSACVSVCSHFVVLLFFLLLPPLTDRRLLPLTGFSSFGTAKKVCFEWSFECVRVCALVNVVCVFVHRK